MALRDIFIGFFIAYTALFFTGCAEPSLENKNVRFEDFVKGVSSYQQKRLRVTDVRIENTSIVDLFQENEYIEPSTPEYYSFSKYKINLILRSPEAVSDLKQKLLITSSSQIDIILEDQNENFWRGWWGMDSNVRYEKILRYTLQTTPCDEVTRVIYREINSIIQHEFEKQGDTEKKLDLDKIFDLLLENRITPYIKNLDSVKRSAPCFGTFDLLKWLRGENATDFAYREYRINKELRYVLEPIVAVLKDLIAKSERKDLIVRIAGYTDPARVKKEGIAIGHENTGVDRKNNVESLHNIRYEKCNGDFLQGTSPSYLKFGDSGGKPIEKITNNCELGAMRAYVMAIYLMGELGKDDVEYFYGTGGVDTGRNTVDSKKRRVRIEFTINSVKMLQPPAA